MTGCWKMQKNEYDNESVTWYILFKIVNGYVWRTSLASHVTHMQNVSHEYHTSHASHVSHVSFVLPVSHESHVSHVSHVTHDTSVTCVTCVTRGTSVTCVTCITWEPRAIFALIFCEKRYFPHLPILFELNSKWKLVQFSACSIITKTHFLARNVSSKQP